MWKPDLKHFPQEPWIFFTVSNYIRQKEAEIEAYKALVLGVQKWCKEYIPRNGNDFTEEGQVLLENPEL